MLQRNSKTVLSVAIFLTLVGLSWGQSKSYFKWEPVKSPSQSPLLLHSADATTSGYGSQYYDDISAPYAGGTTGFYPDSSVPYLNGPYSDESYSADFPKSQPYQYPPDSGSYENYGYRDQNFNITMEKYGGFGGTGDTRGYGAYDYPKKVQEDVPQHLHDDPAIRTDFPDLLRVGRSRIFHRRQPMPIHPLPPPL